MIALISCYWLLVAGTLLGFSNPATPQLSSPNIIINAADSFCASAALDCGGEASIDFAVELSCPQDPEAVEITLLLDLNNDGQFIQPLPASVLQEDGLEFTATFNTIAGNHRLIIRAEDACGDTGQAEHLFVVGEDCTLPPVPGCVAFKEVEFETEWPWIDEIPLPIEDLLQGSLPNLDACHPGTISYAINKVGAPSDINQQEIFLTCDDLLCNNPVQIEVHAWDEAGNQSTCISEVNLINSSNAPCLSNEPGIAGAIATEEGEGLEGVLFAISGPLGYQDTVAPSAGAYFACLPEGLYNIKPFYEDSYYNGVTTFDIILISQHILGVQPLNSPYKMIAADVNGDSSITNEDIIAIRKLLTFGEINSFPNDMPSWVFVKAFYVFPNPSNPWNEEIPGGDTVIIDGNFSLSSLDYVAVKLGDVNLDAETLVGNDIEELSFGGVLPINAQIYTQGEDGEAVIELNIEKEDLLGMQGTFTFDTDQLEYAGTGAGEMKQEDFALNRLSFGEIPFSWIAQPDVYPGQPLLQLKFHVKGEIQDINWETAFGLKSTGLKAEAYTAEYELLHPTLQFGQMATPTVRARPNPFRESVSLDFYLDKAQTGTLGIYDLSGRALIQQDWAGERGYNQIMIPTEALPEGILMYQLSFGGKMWKGKMVKQ